MLTLHRPLRNLPYDDLFHRAFHDMATTHGTGSGWFSPAVDVTEDETAYKVQAELPGVKAEEIDISVHDGVLTLRGERKLETETEKDGLRRMERRYGKFERSFSLPQGTKEDSLEAAVDHGVLTVIIPKPVVETPTPRKIVVKGPELVEKTKQVIGNALKSSSVPVGE